MIHTEGPESQLLTSLLTVFRSVMGGATAVRDLGRQVSGYPESNDLFAAWRQGNWEVIVEEPLKARSGIVLAVYDGEADYWPSSSRLLVPDAIATHEVRFTARPGSVEALGERRLDGDFRFDGFVDMTSGWPERAGQLDFVVCDTGEDPVVFGVEDVMFRLAIVG